MSEFVTIYDFDTRTCTKIPQSELAPGMIRADVEGIGIVWVDPNQLKQGENYNHPPFTGERRDSVLRLVDAFPNVYERSYDFWEDGFRRDANPDKEIAVWLHIAETYGSHSSARPVEEQSEVFSLVVACSNADASTISSVFSRVLISEADFHSIVADYYSL